MYSVSFITYSTLRHLYAISQLHQLPTLKGLIRHINVRKRHTNRSQSNHQNKSWGPFFPIHVYKLFISHGYDMTLFSNIYWHWRYQQFAPKDTRFNIRQVKTFSFTVTLKSELCSPHFADNFFFKWISVIKDFIEICSWREDAVVSIVLWWFGAIRGPFYYHGLT